MLSGIVGARLFAWGDGDALEAAGPQAPLSGLATGLREEHDYEPRLEGKLPAGLRGTLYRNGPGLFERDGYRKRSILDGDGMIQAFDFLDGRVRYRNRFVRTEKFEEEERAGRFLYETWTTRAPGGMFSNLGANIKNQAGVSVWKREGKLFAFDEYAVPVELDPRSLRTVGENDLGATGAKYSAHPKLDAATGQWIHFGLEEGRKLTIHLNVFDAAGKSVARRRVTADRHYYVHDFFVTARHIVLNLHPAILSLAGFLMGTSSLVGGMDWQPELGNTLLVFDRARLDAEPKRIEVPACWMWHALNAYDRDGEIVAEFVGQDAPDTFLGEDPSLFALMQGRDLPQKNPGTLRRYLIDPVAGRARMETLDSDNYEFPIVHPARSCRAHRYGYFVQGDQPGWPFTGLARIDMRTGQTRAFDFGPNYAVGEAVFAPGAGPTPGVAAASPGEPGWLLSLVYDKKTRNSFLAILDAENVGDGPVARLHLRHHSPLSFHGCWAGA